MTLKQRLAWRKKPLRNAASLPFVDWLRDRTSLTSRLQARGAFNLRVLKQGLGMPTLNEAVALGLRRRQIAWIREVALYCDGEPVVFAHTVLPYRPRGPLTGGLARLGNRSLGALLFANPGFMRVRLVNRRIDARHELFDAAIRTLRLDAAPPKSLWARRSRFRYGAQSVLVTEVFAPQVSGFIG